MKKSSKKSSKRISKKLSKKSSKRISKKSSKKSSKKGGITKDNLSKINEYLDKLKSNITEKKLYNFWCFPDDKGVKNRIDDLNPTQIEEMIKKNINKYKGRVICNIRIVLNHRKPDSLTMKAKTRQGVSMPIYMHGQIMCFKIQDTGNIKQIPKSGIMIRWEEEDFKFSKFSLKLIDRLMRIGASKKYYCVETFGCQLSFIVKELREEKIKIDDVLEPLF